MKLSFYVTLLLIFSVQANAKGSFNCNGALQTKWVEYYCVGGSFSDSFKLENITFGTCEGSKDAGEDEEVDIVKIKSSAHNPQLAATSAEWKKAFAYDLTTREFGQAILYIKPETFRSTSYGSIVRLKVTENGTLKDIKLKCGSFN